MTTPDDATFRGGTPRLPVPDIKNGRRVMRKNSMLTAVLILGATAAMVAAGPAAAHPQQVPKTIKQHKKTAAIPESNTGDAMPKWFYLVNRTQAPGNCNGQPLVLTDQSSTKGYGAQLSAQCLKPGLHGQLWVARPYGNGNAYLQSDLGNHLVLSAQNPCSGSAALQPVVLFPEQDPTQTPTLNNAFQLWSYAKAGSFSIDGQTVPIVALSNSTCSGGPLFVQNGQSVYVGSGTGNTAPGNQWYPWPNYPLDAILAQPKVRYPVEQATAYKYISQQLGYTGTCKNTVTAPGGGVATYKYTGIRCAYVNLNLTTSWPNYITQVQNMQPPGNVSAQDWETVTTQLIKEFTYVPVIQTLYSNFNNAYQSLTIQNEADLNGLIGDVLGSPDATDTVKGTAAAVLNGLVYTVLSAAGPEESVLANLMETAVNTANAANSGKLTGQFLVAANDLWDTLSTNFAMVNEALANQEIAILLDWGKLQQVYTLATSSGPGSLEWTPDAQTAFTTDGARGFGVSALQMLFPARYHLTRLTDQADGNPISGPPSNGQYAQFIGTQTNDSAYQLWNKYYVSDNNGKYPGTQALQDLSDYGVAPSDFYLAINGWEGFTTSDGYLDCIGVLTNITNWTGNALTVTANPAQGVIGGNGRSLYADQFDSTASGTTEEVGLNLPPYASLLFGSAYFESGLETDFQIWDSSYSSSNSVATVDIHQHDCSSIETNKTWYDTVSYVGGYTLDANVITTQSGSSPGYIQVNVWR